jgi:uncharacterized protein YwgA
MARTALILSSLRAVEPFQGRTRAQKILYLANICGWNVIDDYRYYNYGPYSDEVATELDNSHTNGWVEERAFQTHDENIAYSYVLTKPGRRVADNLAARLDDPKFVQRTQNLVRELHKFSSEDLEIMATLVFLRKNEQLPSDDDLVERVAELKPRYDMERIRQNLRVFNIIRNFGYKD